MAKTLEHRRKLSEAHKGKDLSKDTKDKISKALSFGNHPRVKLWTILSPTNKIYITKDVATICKEFNLSYSSLRQKGQTQDIRPILWGKSKGWSVLKYEDPTNALEKWNA